MGDPTFDLANFAVNPGFSEAQDRVLREACSGEASSAGLARLRLMKIMSDFREAMGGSFRSESLGSTSTSAATPTGPSNACGTG